MKILPLNNTVRKYKCKLRLHSKANKQTEWANWIITPDGIYIETSCTEPVKADNVEQVEINPFATVRTGKMASKSDADFIKDIVGELDKNEIEYRMEGDSIFITAAELV